MAAPIRAVRVMADLLVADDDVDAGDLLAEVLREEGHEVRVARNGHEALALLKSNRPTLVLLDVEMPLKTGPEMAYAMFVQDCGMEKIPVVLISGVLELAKIAASVGTPYFLGKPYRLDSVLAMVGKALVERIAPRPPAH
jgi:DNA-binding NtrC family response regulator